MMMIKIYEDSQHRGTKERPAYVVFLHYGRARSQEVVLSAKTCEEAEAEVERRFGRLGLISHTHSYRAAVK